MNLNQTNKFRMAKATDLVLDNNSKLFDANEVLKGKHAELKNVLGLLGECHQKQVLATEGFTLEKQNVREDVTIYTLRIASGLGAYATSIGDVNLKKKSHYTPSRLQRVSDPKLYDIGMLLLQQAQPLNGQLDIYFVDQEVLDTYSRLLERFKEIIPQNRVATGTRKASTLNISNLFRELDKLLKEDIDALMLPFQFVYPNFYQEYKNARMIIDYTGRGKSQEETDTETDKS